MRAGHRNQLLEATAPVPRAGACYPEILSALVPLQSGEIRCIALQRCKAVSLVLCDESICIGDWRGCQLESIDLGPQWPFTLHPDPSPTMGRSALKERIGRGAACDFRR